MEHHGIAPSVRGPRSFKDWIGIAITSIIIFVISSYFDPFEYFFVSTQHYQYLQLDEIAIVLMLLSIVLTIFSIGRSRKLTRDMAEWRHVEQSLSERSRRLEVIGSISAEITRELDLSVLLSLILSRAIDLLGRRSGAVYLWDEAQEVLAPRTWQGLPEWMPEVRLRAGEGIAGHVAQRRAGLLVNNYRDSPYAHPSYAPRMEYAAIVAEPLLYRDRLLGVITINSLGTQEPFTEQDRNLLGLFATQAAIAIENARLFQENQRELDKLSALHEVSRAVTGQLEVGQLAQAIYHQVRRVVDTQKMVIFLYEKDREEFDVILRMVENAPDPTPGRWFAFGPGLISLIVARRQVIRTDDYEATCRREGVEPMAASIPFPYWLGVPMVVGEEVIGILGRVDELLDHDP